MRGYVVDHVILAKVFEKDVQTTFLKKLINILRG